MWIATGLEILGAPSGVGFDSSALRQNFKENANAGGTNDKYLGAFRS